MRATTQAPLEIVQEFLLNKAQKAGVDISEDCSLKGFTSASGFLNNGRMKVLLLKENPSIKERVKSLACFFAISKIPGGFKKMFRCERTGGYFWFETVNGERDPEIDRRANRYLSFLSFKARNK